MKTIVGVFEDFEQAQNAVRALERAGVPRGDVSLVANNEDGHFDQYATGSASSAEDLGDVVASDAAAGAMVGGAAGLVMAVTGIVFPGFGAVVAAGWLVSTLATAAVGAAAGGIVGALTGAGVPLEDAVYYKEGLRQGRTLVLVRTTDEMAARVTEILSDYGADFTDVSTTAGSQQPSSR